MRLPYAIPRSPVSLTVFAILLAFVHLGWAAEATTKPDPPGTRTTHVLFSPANLRFGQVAVGKARIQTVTITNMGESDRKLLRVVTEGKGFTLSGLDLPLTLSKGESFTFRGIFAPGFHGTARGSISFVWENPDIKNPAPILGMSGIGADEELTVDPAMMNFGAVPVGSTSSLAGKLTAPGSAVTISSAVISNSEFNCTGLSFPFTIPAGGSQDFMVVFLPQVSSAASATLSFLDDAGNTLAIEDLTGTGILLQNYLVDLSWNASTSQDVIGYNVYRGNTSGGPYQKINSVLDASTVYTDTSVADGETYYYVSTAVNSNEQESVYSNEAQAVIPGDAIAGGRGRIVIRPTFTRQITTARPVPAHH
jgi:hypothetical protein